MASTLPEETRVALVDWLRKQQQEAKKHIIFECEQRFGISREDALSAWSEALMPAIGRKVMRFEAAVAAMQGLLSADAARFLPGNLSPVKVITKASVGYADALLALLDGEVSDG